jgi:hypothetical protein
MANVISDLSLSGALWSSLQSRDCSIPGRRDGSGSSARNRARISSVT